MSIMNPIAIKEILEKHYIINFTNESKVDNASVQIQIT